MHDFFEKFLLCFIPLFVAIDSVGVLPLFINLTGGLKIEEKKKLITEATAAALLISILFIFAGRVVFTFLGITENDFRIAGGLILLLISISDVAFSGLRLRSHQGSEVGVVPIGIPLIIGPGALTTILLLVDQFGIWHTIFALVVNLGIVWISFRKSDLILKVMGDPGSRAFAKVMALFLAAIAIMMIRVGLTGIIQQR